MFKNKFFIKKLNGIKHRGMNRMKKKLFITILSMLVLIISWCTQVKADDMKSYTQPFQNSTQTLSGKSVSDNTYFTKIELPSFTNC